MRDRTELLSKSLSNLKPLLPAGAYEAIAQKLPNYSADKVRNAFRGVLKNEKELVKILTEARILARENFSRYQKANRHALQVLRRVRSKKQVKF